MKVGYKATTKFAIAILLQSMPFRNPCSKAPLLRLSYHLISTPEGRQASKTMETKDDKFSSMLYAGGHMTHNLD